MNLIRINISKARIIAIANLLIRDIQNSIEMFGMDAEQLLIAAQEFDPQAGINPNNNQKKGLVIILIEHGAQLERRREIAEGINSYKTALELDPNNSQTKKLLSKACTEIGINLANDENSFEKAIAYLSEALQYNPLNEEAKLSLSTIYNDSGVAEAEKGQYDKALENFKKAIELSPKEDIYQKNLSKIYVYIGKKFVVKKEYESAISLFKQALEIYKDNVVAKHDLSKVYHSIGNLKTNACEYDEAIENFEKALELNPDNVKLKQDFSNAYIHKGKKLEEENKYKEAIASFYKAHKIEPEAVLPKKYLSSTYIKIGEQTQSHNLDKAIEYYENALKFNPQNAIAKEFLVPCYNNLASNHDNVGHHKTALTYYKKALELSPNNTIIISNEYICRAQIALKTGHYDKAIAYLVKVLQLEPDNLNFKEQIIKILENHPHAIKTLPKTIQEFLAEIQTHDSAVDKENLYTNNSSEKSPQEIFEVLLGDNN